MQAVNAVNEKRVPVTAPRLRLPLPPQLSCNFIVPASNLEQHPSQTEAGSCSVPGNHPATGPSQLGSRPVCCLFERGNCGPCWDAGSRCRLRLPDAVLGRVASSVPWACAAQAVWRLQPPDSQAAKPVEGLGKSHLNCLCLQAGAWCRSAHTALSPRMARARQQVRELWAAWRPDISLDLESGALSARRIQAVASNLQGTECFRSVLRHDTCLRTSTFGYFRRKAAASCRCWC